MEKDSGYQGFQNSELERLAILSEEIGEVSQVISSIILNGINGQYSDAPLDEVTVESAFGYNFRSSKKTNLEQLVVEVGDIYVILFFMKMNNDISTTIIREKRTELEKKINKRNLFSETDLTKDFAVMLSYLGSTLQMIGKTMRHGYSSRNPVSNDYCSNRDLLSIEIGKLTAFFDVLIERKIIDQDSVNARIEYKKEKIKRYMHFN